jgi:hypothetical protein
MYLGKQIWGGLGFFLCVLLLDWWEQGIERKGTTSFNKGMVGGHSRGGGVVR